MIRHIATAAVYVDDQQAAVDFWTDKVGFEVRRNQPMGPQANWIEVGPKGAETCLVLYPKSMMPNWAELKPSIVFECSNIQQTFEEMKAKGVTFIEGLEVMQWGTYARFRDVDGYEYLLKTNTTE